MNIQPGGLAVIVKGLWPNIGRVVYVDRYLESWDFTELGLGRGPGWRVRTWSQGPLQTTDGPRLVGYTPDGSLRPLPGLPPDQARQVQREMAIADFQEAMNELAQILRAPRTGAKALQIEAPSHHASTCKGEAGEVDWCLNHAVDSRQSPAAPPRVPEG